MSRFTFLSICICTALAAPPASEDPLQAISTGNNQFAVAVYKEILKNNESNVVFSPFSAEVILALASEGANGDTRTELINALQLPEAPEKIRKGFKEILPKLKVQNDDVKLFSANKMYVQDGVQFVDAFKKIAEDDYQSGIENVNFKNNVEATHTINEWVENQTNKKIQDLLSPEVISSDTVLVLVNTLYLNAKWRSSFDEKLTKSDKFYLTSTKSVEKRIMTKVQYANYYENKELNAQFLELPYRFDGLSMIFILPNDIEGLASLETHIEAVFQSQPWQKETVDIKIPSFIINSGIDFKTILKSLGVNKLFGVADLRGIFTHYKDLGVSDVVQKAFVNVTEGGTEAAAATALVAFTRSGHAVPVPTKTFHATHPFIYLIKYNDLILFAGKYAS